MSQSSFVNATKRRFGRSEQDPFVLNDPEDPKLGWHLLKESQYCDHPLAQLHPLYWNKGVHHLENLLPFIPVPPEFVPSKALYVFEQYVYTEQRIDKFREERMPTTRPPGLALIGSPGIGRTTFLLYYLIRELARARPTVYFCWGRFYIFNKNGVHSIGKEPEFGIAWAWTTCLVDADTIHPPPDELMIGSFLFVLSASSPRADDRRWINQRQDSREFAINPPSRKELVKVLSNRNLPNVTENEIESAIQMFGYNMHTLFQVLRAKDGPTQFKRAIHAKVLQLEFISLGNLMRLDAEDIGIVSLLVSRCVDQPLPSTRKYLGTDVLSSGVASPAVWTELLHVHGKGVYSQIRSMPGLFHRIPETASSAGWLWESLCHERLIAGGTFTVKEMVSTGGHLTPSDDATSISLPRLEPCYYSPADGTTKANHYYLPAASDNPAIDSFFHWNGVGVGLQMTLGSNHSLKPKGLELLYGHLKKVSSRYFIVFVIRKGSVFECKAPSGKQMERFTFCTLELPLPSELDPDLFNDAVEIIRGNGEAGEMDQGDNEDEEVSADTH